VHDRPVSARSIDEDLPIACIPGDGIGKEVVPAGQQVLQALAAGAGHLRLTSPLWLGRRLVPRPWRDDAGRWPGRVARHGRHPVRFGGRPAHPRPCHLWGLRLKICQGFDQYANVRPTRILPGIDAPLKRCGPQDLDWVIVRENSEGEYAGVGGRAHQGHPIEVATDVSMMTRAGVERIMRFAFRPGAARARASC
jgi:tartrate dehydrogenase/decarboxylase/D-malate dehydrogenase